MCDGWFLTLTFCLLTTTGVDASASELIGNRKCGFDSYCVYLRRVAQSGRAPA